MTYNTAGLNPIRYTQGQVKRNLAYTDRAGLQTEHGL